MYVTVFATPQTCHPAHSINTTARVVVHILTHKACSNLVDFAKDPSVIKLCTKLGIACVLQSTTRVKPFICTMPMRLDEGWNQIQFNLSDFTRRAYGESQTAASCQCFHSIHMACMPGACTYVCPCASKLSPSCVYHVDAASG